MAGAGARLRLTEALLLDRLAADRPILEEILGVPAGAPLERAVPMGDPHRGGQRVLAVEFAGGRSVVYKPRSLAADLAWQGLLEFAGDSPAGPRLVDRGTHGWSERLEVRDCRDEAEVEAFYRRLGRVLALSALLLARDVHAENVLAVGPHPVVVDLECLLEPGWTNPFRKAPFGDPLVETMILPRPVVLEGAVHDFSAVAGDPARALPPLLARAAPAIGFRNRPRLAGRAVDWRPHRAPLEGGFEETTRALIARKEQVPLGPFRGVETRLVLRPTYVYLALLEASREVADRRGWLEGATRRDLPAPDLAALAAAEARDLEAFDVPIFSARTDERRIVDSRGATVLELDGPSGWEALLGRVEGLGAADVESGLRTIETAWSGAAPRLEI